MQVVFLNIGLCVTLLAIAFVFKKYARVILWSGAITLFVGTLLLVGLGIANPASNNKAGSSGSRGTIMFLISAAVLVIGAEIPREKNIVNVEEVVPVDTETVLSETLDIELTRRVFAEVIGADYMKEDDTRYKWNESEVLLTYMCRCIHRGDKSIPSESDDKGPWKFGETLFPDTRLNNLSDILGLG